MSTAAAGGGPAGRVGGACPRVAVLALGSPDRGDDAVGELVAARLERLLPEVGTGAVALVRGGPWAVLDLPGGIATVIVVDAVRAPLASGSVLVRDLRGDPLPFPRRRGGGPELRPEAGGSHALPLAECLALAAALGRLPARAWLVGVVGAEFTPLSAAGPAVRAGAARAAEIVARQVAAALGGDPSEPRPGPRR